MNTAPVTVIVAVVGGSGAGKSWLVRRLCELLGENAGHLALDDFYRDRSHLPPARRARLNFDIPHAIDWRDAAAVLRACRQGAPTAVPRYDFATYSRRAAAEPWQPRPVVFVEGLWLLRSPALRGLFDVRLYLDAPAPLRSARRVARDTVERGYSASAVQARLAANVLPMHERYVEPQKRWADLVLSQPFEPDAVARLANLLWPLLSAAGTLPDKTLESFRGELDAALLAHAYAN